MERNNAGSPNGIQNAASREKTLFGNVNEGNIAVSFSDADLEVLADFIPPLGGGQPLDLNGVAAILEKINVVHGVRQQAIEAALGECNRSRHKVGDVVIAGGDAPSNEVAEYFEVSPILVQSTKMDSNGRIDYRTRSPFVIVKKGQTLAKLRPRKPGVEGKNVHGDALPFTVIRPEGVISGANTRVEDDAIVADINGQLVESKKVLSVQETLHIKGGIGYNTGNITFPGDVVIEGPVSDGFTIVTGGALLIKQTFDVTKAITKGDMVVLGGIIGKGMAVLKSGGGIKTKFIENCHAAARKAIVIDSEINNSSVFTLGRIEMGEKGIILGGDIYAVHGIKAAGIGKKAGKATRIHCGIDFTAQQEKERCNNVLRMLAAKLPRLRELMAGPDIDAEKMAKMEELRSRLEKEQQEASTRVAELMGKINIAADAAVEVTGEIAPGTLIEICQVALYVSEPLRKVRVRLDDTGGKLVSEPL